MRPVNGAEALARALERSGVTHVFGLPGTQNAALFSALARTGIRTVLTGSELAASFMANGFHRAGGPVPVVAAIPGPGFTWALTGFVEAAHDNAALVLLTGTPDERPGKRFGLQAIDQAGMVRGLARAVHRLEDPAQADGVAAAAVRSALEHGPGPVLLEVTPAALGAALVAPRDAKVPADGSQRPAASPPWAELVSEVVAQLAQARRVVILAGQGCAAAAPQLAELVARRPAMVMTTASGRGVLPESHPWSLGFDFLASDVEAANRLLNEADIVLLLACRTSHNGTGGFALRLPEDRTVQVDLDPAVLAANVQPRWVLHGEVGEVLAQLLAGLDGPAPVPGWTTQDVTDWRGRLRRRRRPNPAEPAFPGVADGRASAFFAALRDVAPDDAILVTDTGQHQIMARAHWRVEAPRGLILPADFQSMGFGLPAAIGAALAAPDRRVIAVLGDGGLMMVGLELATAVREGVDLAVIVFRDGHLGQIRAQQASAGHGEAAVELAGVDLAALATATGARYRLLEEDAERVLVEVCEAHGVTLVDVPLGESPAMAQARRRGALRGMARRALGPRGLRLARRWLRRD